MDSVFFQKEKIGLKLPVFNHQVIFYCVLNWGVGHATRSIPIIRNYVDSGNRVIIFSDGEAEELLRNSFPEQTFHTLPSYKIRYTSQRFLFLFIVLQSITRWWVIYREQRQIQSFQRLYNPSVVISDNRYGCYLRGVRNYLISHQLKLVTFPILEHISQKFIQKLIRPFDELWIPDMESVKLSGAMTDVSIPISKRWIGFPDLKLEANPMEQDIELLILLSGPEPRRSELEKKYLNVIGALTQHVVFISGNFSEKYKLVETKNCTHHSRMRYEETLHFLMRAKRIVCRSGYSTLIDLYVLGKDKVICVPTAGQPEQEYLADFWSKNEWFLTIREQEVESRLAREISKLN